MSEICYRSSSFESSVLEEENIYNMQVGRPQGPQLVTPPKDYNVQCECLLVCMCSAIDWWPVLAI